MQKASSLPKSKSARATTPKVSGVRKTTARKPAALKATTRKSAVSRPAPAQPGEVGRIAVLAAGSPIAPLGRPLRTLGSVAYGLVDFSYQDIDYQIDLEKSKVYRQFIEVEKARTNSIITAYRAILGRPRPTL